MPSEKPKEESKGQTVTYQGTKSGRAVDVVWVGDHSFRRGASVSDVPSDVVDALRNDEYYDDYEFDLGDKGE